MAATAITLYPFIPPEPDCEKAVQFFESGGFTQKWSDGDLSGLRFGGAYFPLQKIDVLEREANQMASFEVDDLECYWEELSALEQSLFPGASLKEPADYPWEREIHFVGPGGVCRHLRKDG